MRQLLAILGGCALVIFVARGFMPYDDTDPPGGRSGLVPLTDAATGCEYLSVSRAGITPRLQADGKQRGCRSTP